MKSEMYITLPMQKLYIYCARIGAHDCFVHVQAYGCVLCTGVYIDKAVSADRAEKRQK